MAIACPVCRAVNDAGPACRRCKADLALCFAVERQRAAAMTRAAPAAARRAHGLRRGPDSARRLAALSLLAGDFPAAWALYDTASKE